MSDSASNGGSVFPSFEEREKAIEILQREAPSGVPDAREMRHKDLLIAAQGFGYELPDCGCGESQTCECNRSNARGQSSSRSRSQSQSRSSRRANMAAVPGQVNRDVERDRGRERENADEYPAGGRSNWEKQKMGVTDGEDDEFPAGGRSAWEKRKTQRRRANSTSADSADDAGDSYPTGSRSSFEQRQNATVDVDEQEWLDHEYPLTAKRHAEEEREKQERWERLREQAKRNDTNTVRSRHNDSS